MILHLNIPRYSSGEPAAARSESSISPRLEFTQLSEVQLNSIRSSKAVLLKELPKALDKFYEQLRACPAVSHFFSSPQQITGAKDAQSAHWSNIANGDLNDKFVAKSRAIGSVHARIGLKPQWYIGGYAIVLEHLIRGVVAEKFPKRATAACRALAQKVALIAAMIAEVDTEAPLSQSRPNGTCNGHSDQHRSTTARTVGHLARAI